MPSCELRISERSGFAEQGFEFHKAHIKASAGVTKTRNRSRLAVAYRHHQSGGRDGVSAGVWRRWKKTLVLRYPSIKEMVMSETLGDLNVHQSDDGSCDIYFSPSGAANGFKPSVRLQTRTELQAFLALTNLTPDAIRDATKDLDSRHSATFHNVRMPSDLLLRHSLI
jgi:hypothetical protein